VILADSSVWIDYVNGLSAPYTERLDFELLHNRVVIIDPVITEFLQGFRNDRDFIKAQMIIDSLEYRDLGGKEAAIKAAVNFRTLRKKGITVRKTMDVIIATFCIENLIPLLHNDSDFLLMQKPLGLLTLL
jgi:predicted nucleic acid-binding protein